MQKWLDFILKKENEIRELTEELAMKKRMLLRFIPTSYEIAPECTVCKSDEWVKSKYPHTHIFDTPDDPDNPRAVNIECHIEHGDNEGPEGLTHTGYDKEWQKSILGALTNE